MKLYTVRFEDQGKHVYPLDNKMYETTTNPHEARMFTNMLDCGKFREQLDSRYSHLNLEMVTIEMHVEPVAPVELERELALSKLSKRDKEVLGLS